MKRQSRINRLAAQIAMVLAWLFAAGVVVQIFLAGLSLFDNASRWADHRSFGMTIGILPILLLIVVLIGRLPRQIIGMSVVLLVLYVIQINLPEINSGYIAALHPLVAFALLGLPFQLGSRLLGYSRQPALAPARAGGDHERSDSTWTSS